MPIEELRMQLEILRLYVGKNNNVIGFQYFFITPRFKIIEIPGRHASDLEFATRFNGVQQPMSVVDEVQAFRSMIEGSLGIDRTQLDRPVADVIYFFHGVK